MDEVTNILGSNWLKQRVGGNRFNEQALNKSKYVTDLESLISVFAIDPDSRKIKIKLFEAIDIYLHHSGLTSRLTGAWPAVGQAYE